MTSERQDRVASASAPSVQNAHRLRSLSVSFCGSHYLGYDDEEWRSEVIKSLITQGHRYFGREMADARGGCPRKTDECSALPIVHFDADT